MLAIPPKLQAAFDQGVIEPVITAEFATGIIDKSSADSVMSAFQGSVDIPASKKNVRMGYPDPTATASVFRNLPFTGTSIPTSKDFFRMQSYASTIYIKKHMLGRQVFRFDEDFGASKTLKAVHIAVRQAGQGFLRCRLYGSDPNGTLMTIDHKPIFGDPLNSGVEASNSLTLTSASITTRPVEEVVFNFSQSLVSGRHYAIVPYLDSTNSADVAWMGVPWLDSTGWFLPIGTLRNSFSNNPLQYLETAKFRNVTQNNLVAGRYDDEAIPVVFWAYTDGAPLIDVKVATFDSTPQPILQVQFDMGQLPTVPGEWKINDLNVDVFDNVTRTDQRSSLSYQYWGGTSLGAKTIGPFSFDPADGASLVIPTANLRQFYVLEVSFTATANGLRSPVFIEAKPTFQKEVVVFATHSLPNFTSNVFPAIKESPSFPTSLNLKSDITKRGSMSLRLSDIGGEVTRFAVGTRLANTPVKVRFGHKPTAKSVEDLVEIYNGVIKKYSYQNGNLDLDIEDITVKFEVKIPIIRSGTFSESPTVLRSFRGLTLIRCLRKILDDTGIPARVINDSSFTDYDAYLLGSNLVGSYRTQFELSEQEEAKKLVEELQKLLRIHMTQLEDGILKIIQFPRTDTAVDTWVDADFITGIKQTGDYIDSIVNVGIVGYSSVWGEEADRVVTYGDADSIEINAPGTDIHLADRTIKTRWLGPDSVGVANEIAKRLVDTFKDGLAGLEFTTLLNKFKVQVGDYVNIVTTNLLIPGQLGTPVAGTKFMVTSKTPDIDNGLIRWKMIEAKELNRKPTGHFTLTPRTGKPTGGTPLTVSLNPSASVDDDGTIVLYEVDFDYDGTNFTVDASQANPTPAITHDYDTTAIGYKQVALRVTDNNGAVHIQTRATDDTEDDILAVVRVQNGPTAVISVSDPAPERPSIVDVSSASFATSGVIVLVEWDIDYNGSFVTDETGQSIKVPLLRDAQDIALKVTDEDGHTDTATATLPGSLAAIMPMVDIMSVLTSQWRELPNPVNAALFDSVWNGSLFCAVGLATGADAYIITSPDGEVWTERANPDNTTLHGIAWNGSIFCAVGNSGYIVTSPDGITWTKRTSPLLAALFDVTWNGSIFCAVGDQAITDAYILTSPDGITWTQRANPKNFILWHVTWNGSIFCAVGDPDGTDSYMITSPDGITWTERANPRNITLQNVEWNGFIFLAVGGDATNTYICGSRNGIDWFNREMAITSGKSLNSTSWNGFRFILVGASGVDDAMLFSSLSIIN